MRAGWAMMAVIVMSGLAGGTAWSQNREGATMVTGDPGSLAAGAVAANRPLVCAHRGCSGGFPENTMPAFKAAVELGADFIELDVHRSADGEIICLHDATVDRTTNGQGKVSEMTLAELQGLEAGVWKGAQFVGVRLPTLREVLTEIAPQMVLHIEIKQRGIVEQVVQLVREMGMLRQVAIISFNADDLRVARAAEPSIACGLITSAPPEATVAGEQALVAQTLACGANFISCNHGCVTASLVHTGHLLGVLIMAWTMDSPDSLQRMIEMGVDGLVSNFPERALQLTGRLR